MLNRYIADTCVISGQFGDSQRQAVSDPYKYMWQVQGRWVLMTCAHGTKFDLNECKCITDANRE